MSYEVSRWTAATQPLITKEQIERATRKATVWQKIKLLFRPSHFSIDDKSVIRYKEMNGTIFVMKRGTKL